MGKKGNVTHGKGKKPIGSLVDAIGRCDVGMTVIHRTSHRQLVAVIIKTGECFKLEIKYAFKHTYLHQGAFTANGLLSVLEPADIWCAKVLDYDALVKEEGYKVLDMELKVKTSNGIEVTTTRCPIRVDGKLLSSQKGAPFLGEHTETIRQEFLKKAVVNG